MGSEDLIKIQNVFFFVEIRFLVYYCTLEKKKNKNARKSKEFYRREPVRIITKRSAHYYSHFVGWWFV